MRAILQSLSEIWAGGGWLMLPLFCLTIFIYYTALRLWFQLEDCLFVPSTRRGQAENLSIVNHRIRFLRAIISVPPLMGILGTVSGMFSTFDGMARGFGDLQIVIGGISEALITTQVGLIVSLPAVIILAIIVQKRDLKIIMKIITRSDEFKICQADIYQKNICQGSFSKFDIQGDSQRISASALMCACVFSFVLFFIISMMQTFHETPKALHSHEIIHMISALPRDLPIVETSEKDDRDLQIPVLQNDDSTKSILQYEPDLNFEMGTNIGKLALPFLEMDIAEETDLLLDFGELSEIPTLLNAEMLRAKYPDQLRRKGIFEVRVLLEIVIDKKGKVDVQRILKLSHDHPQVREAARSVASNARFSITKVGGNPIKVRGQFPLTLKAKR